jgi:hypothetical protein
LQQLLERKQLTPADGASVSADVGPERFCRHEESPGEPMRGLPAKLVVTLHIHDHVPEFMGEIEALPFAVDATTDNDDGHRQLLTPESYHGCNQFSICNSRRSGVVRSHRRSLMG